MKNQSLNAEKTIDAYGMALARRLDRDGPELAYDISERLRAARMQAMAVRKPELITATTLGLSLSAGQAMLHQGGQGHPLWSRLASFLPLVALILGLIAIQSIQSESTAMEIAEVDSALLLDELPPMAYTDPGFLQFLKINQAAQAEVH
jgi:Protein of unknown function (DUF3619)